MTSSQRAGAAVSAVLAAAALLAWLNHRGHRGSDPIDIILVTIDTLRADHLGCYGDAQAATPVLDRLAAGGTRFAWAIAPIPLTLPSHVSLFTATTPLVHDVRDNVGFSLSPSLPTLAERFASAGYDTAAFVSGFSLNRSVGLARGFGVYDDRFTRGGDAARPAAVERRGDETVAAAVAWLERAREDARPLFVWVHLFDPHAPYDPPEPYRTRFSQHLYDGEVAFTDAQLGVLLEALRQARPNRPALVAVTADHGEGLGDHDEPTHGLFVYDSTVHVPLVISGPGVGAGRVETTAVRLIDLAPTLLDIAGVAPLDRAEGVSLRPMFSSNHRPIDGRPAYVESLFGRLCCGWAPLHAWRDGRWMLIDAPHLELYDIPSDPGQLRNVAAAHPDEVARLRLALDAALERERAANPGPATADTRDRLRSLGYAAGGGGVKPSLRDPKEVVGLSTRIGQAVEIEDAEPASAQALFERLLQEDPTNPLIRRHLGMAFMAQRQYERASQILGALAADGDAGAETAALLADLAIERGDLADARSRLEALHARNSEDTEIAFKLGIVLAQAGDPDRAVSLFRSVVDRAPQNVDALVDLGGALLKLGRSSEAVPYFARAADRAAASPLVWNGLGFAKLESGDPAGAVNAFQRSLRLDPNQPEVTAALRQATAAR
jgi:arylsulfatase A-like enzyme/Tfp pilus assembly protein PilF